MIYIKIIGVFQTWYVTLEINTWGLFKADTVHLLNFVKPTADQVNYWLLSHWARFVLLGQKDGEMICCNLPLIMLYYCGLNDALWRLQCEDTLSPSQSVVNVYFLVLLNFKCVLKLKILENCAIVNSILAQFVFGFRKQFESGSSREGSIVIALQWLNDMFEMHSWVGLW